MTTTEAIDSAISVRDTLWLLATSAELPSRNIVKLLQRQNTAIEVLVTEQNGFSAERVTNEQRRIRLCTSLALQLGAEVMESDKALVASARSDAPPSQRQFAVDAVPA
jgi:hypothetical protein